MCPNINQTRIGLHVVHYRGSGLRYDMIQHTVRSKQCVRLHHAGPTENYQTNIPTRYTDELIFFMKILRDCHIAINNESANIFKPMSSWLSRCDAQH